MLRKGLFFSLLLFFGLSLKPLLAQNNTAEEDAAKSYELQEIDVQASRTARNVLLEPGKTSMDLENYKSPGSVENILDVLKQRPIIDFRKPSDLSPSENEDGVYLRGFDSRKFVTALNGLPVQKIGGYWGGHFMDFSLIPMEQVQKVEIIPGPHSALYSGRAIGGVFEFGE